MRFKGKVVFVSGSAQGMGAVEARLFAEEGDGGTVATATRAGSVATGATVLATSAYAASGINANVKLSVQVKRRRRRGWRRFFPVPAWKRMIFSTLLGTIFGLCISIFFQQNGLYELSVESIVWSLVAGGGVTFGVGYFFGAIWTFVKPPKED